MNIRKIVAVILSVLLLLPSLSVGSLPVVAATATTPTATISCYGGVSQGYVLNIGGLVGGQTYTLSALWKGEGSTYSLFAYGNAFNNSEDTAMTFATGSRGGNVPGLTYNPDTCLLTYTFVSQGTSFALQASLKTGSGSNASAHLADVMVKSPDGTAVYTMQGEYTDGVLTGFVNDSTTWGNYQHCSFAERPYSLFYLSGPISGSTCAHTFDNNCDADCNTCGAARAALPHAYSNTQDTTCNTCGASRSSSTLLPTVKMRYYSGGSNQCYSTTVSGLSAGTV